MVEVRSRALKRGARAFGVRAVGLALCEISAADHIPVTPAGYTVNMGRRLSKSRFQKGLQCEKALWLAVHRRDLITDPPEATQWIFDQGSEVGRLAWQLFPGGVEVTEDYQQPAEALATTRRLLAEGATVLYEPAFECGAAFARVDILVAAGDGTWDLYEVKSSTSAKPEHTTDAAVQAYAVEGSGLALRSINIVHVDSSYVYEGGPYDVHRLLAVADITSDARAFMAEVPTHLERLAAMLEGPEPEVVIGARCSSPYTCDFTGYCHAFLPADYPVTALPRISEEQLHSLLAAGITSMRDVPTDLPGLSRVQAEALEVVRSGEPRVDAVGLARSLKALEWPVYHLDFETLAPALPLWPGTRPYETIPFQYSIHVQSEDGACEHREYLHPGRDDPRRALTAHMLVDLGEAGSITHYTAYERTQLKGLAAALPEFSEQIAEVIARLVDLEPIIRNNTRHPDAAGRSSIKYVLPAWCPDLSYAALAIGDGQIASARYLRVLKGHINGEDAGQVMDDLLEYCGLDTFAMVRLLDEMRRLAADGTER